MTGIPTTRRSMLLRMAILLIAVCQLGVMVLPHEGAAPTTTTRPHLHAPGDGLQISHDETACPVCGANHASRTVAVGSSRLIVFLSPRVEAFFGATEAPSQIQRTHTAHSRAPPSHA